MVLPLVSYFTQSSDKVNSVCRPAHGKASENAKYFSISFPTKQLCFLGVLVVVH